MGQPTKKYDKGAIFNGMKVVVILNWIRYFHKYYFYRILLVVGLRTVE